MADVKWFGSEDLGGMLTGVDAFTLDPQNARIHTERSIDAIAHSLTRFGQLKPIVVDEHGVVLAGNGTLLAIHALGWTHVAAVRFDGDRLAGRGFKIADNRTPELSRWDEGGLAAALASYREGDPGALTVTGFNPKEVQDLLDRLSQSPTSAPDVASERPPTAPLSRTVFSVVFSSAEDLATWDEFVKSLAHQYPEILHPSDRVVAHLNETVFRSE